ncbi:FERM domain-containing protein 8 isoform X3 [Alligator sinensis]|nr:FERM domain-containing protein 8 isoform X3 [Alligator sinensis]
MENEEGAAVPPSPAQRSQRSSVSSTGARVLDVVVYLVDDTPVPLAVENLPSVSAHELHRGLRDALQLPDVAADAFALWLISPLLEVQLKPRHQPYKLCRQWPELLFRFTDCSEEEIAQDEPALQFRRNVFFPKHRELQVESPEVLRLLYEEAKLNVLEGRYPCDPEDGEQLGALACRLTLGPYDPDRHTPGALKTSLGEFLPPPRGHRGGGLLGVLRKRGSTRAPAPELGLLEAFRALRDEAASPEPEAQSRLHHTYLQHCHRLPYYGCAFFPGEIDRPAQGFLHRGGRKPVSVAISLEGVYIVDSKEKDQAWYPGVGPGLGLTCPCARWQHVLLGLRFQELSWDHTFPEEAAGGNGDHVLWLEFDGQGEDGSPVNKLLKIYSKQAELMSGLIEYCIELSAGAEVTPPEPPTGAVPSDHPRPRLQRQDSVVCSRLQQLATIDYVEDGQEIRRVKPRRTASFFTRQLSHGPTTYVPVRPAEA